MKTTVTAEELRQFVRTQTEADYTYMGRPLSEMSREDLVYAVIHLGRLLRASNATVPFVFSVSGETEAAPIPLRRCTRCGERVRVEGETVLCDGVVSKLAPLSVHEEIDSTQQTTTRPTDPEHGRKI